VGQEKSAAEYAGQLHVFYLGKGDVNHSDWLRHGWFDGQWHFDDLDGYRASGGSGRTDREVGRYPTAVVYGGELHVFYQGYWSSSGVLRHAHFNGTQWSFEDLDGHDLTGGATAAVGEWNTSLVVGSELHVWYLGHTPGAPDPCRCVPPAPPGDGLRHAWFDGSTWRFEFLDGFGTSDDGRVPNGVGGYNAAVLQNGEPHVFYTEPGTEAVRHAWRAGGTWNFEYVVGPANPTLGYLPRWVSATAAGGSLHVFFYVSRFGILKHHWLDGSGWHDDVLDGSGGQGGGENIDVGQYTVAATVNDEPHVWYSRAPAENTPVLGHASFDGSWHFERLSGPDVSGAFNTVVVSEGVPQVFSGSTTLQHAYLS